MGGIMVLIYRLISIIAALLVIVIGGSWLAHKYKVGPDIGLWKTRDWEEVYRLREEKRLENDGVPATESGTVSIPLHGRGRTLPWEAEEGRSLIIPVSVEERRGFDRFNRYGSYYGGFFSAGGACRDKIVNLLVVNSAHPEGRPVFDQRVFLPAFFYLSDGEEEAIAALVVANDTNSDGRLDCGDEAKFQIMDLVTREIVVAEHSFIPENLTRVWYDRREDAFAFAEVSSSKNDVSIRSIKIARDDLTMTETLAPDLIGKAQAAYDNAASD